MPMGGPQAHVKLGSMTEAVKLSVKGLPEQVFSSFVSALGRINLAVLGRTDQLGAAKDHWRGAKPIFGARQTQWRGQILRSVGFIGSPRFTLSAWMTMLAGHLGVSRDWGSACAKRCPR